MNRIAHSAIFKLFFCIERRSEHMKAPKERNVLNVILQQAPMSQWSIDCHSSSSMREQQWWSHIRTYIIIPTFKVQLPEPLHSPDTAHWNLRVWIAKCSLRRSQGMDGVYYTTCHAYGLGTLFRGPILKSVAKRFVVHKDRPSPVYSLDGVHSKQVAIRFTFATLNGYYWDD